MHVLNNVGGTIKCLHKLKMTKMISNCSNLKQITLFFSFSRRGVLASNFVLQSVFEDREEQGCTRLLSMEINSLAIIYFL